MCSTLNIAIGNQSYFLMNLYCWFADNKKMKSFLIFWFQSQCEFRMEHENKKKNWNTYFIIHLLILQWRPRVMELTALWWPLVALIYFIWYQADSSFIITLPEERNITLKVMVKTNTSGSSLCTCTKILSIL